MEYCKHGKMIMHDGQLGTATPEMATHVDGCPQCRKALESEKKNTKSEGLGSKISSLVVDISRRLG